MWIQSTSVTDRQTDGRTDGQTDRITITDTVQRIASHGKKRMSNVPQLPTANGQRDCHVALLAIIRTPVAPVALVSTAGRQTINIRRHIAANSCRYHSCLEQHWPAPRRLSFLTLQYRTLYYYYTVSQKSCANLFFCQNFVKFRPIVKIFGTKIAKKTFMLTHYRAACWTQIFQIAT